MGAKRPKLVMGLVVGGSSCLVQLALPAPLPWPHGPPAHGHRCTCTLACMLAWLQSAVPESWSAFFPCCSLYIPRSSAAVTAAATSLYSPHAAPQLQLLPATVVSHVLCRCTCDVQRRRVRVPQGPRPAHGWAALGDPLGDTSGLQVSCGRGKGAGAPRGGGVANGRKRKQASCLRHVGAAARGA